MKTFTQEQVLDLLINFDQSMDPKYYPGCENLTSDDFLDAAYSNAKRLGLLKEFEELREQRINKNVVKYGPLIKNSKRY
jgi:hypothetical protein